MIDHADWSTLEILHRHFPEAVEFPSTEPPCEKYIVSIWTPPKSLPFFGQTKESNKQLAMEQKVLLQDLFRAKNRPDPFSPQNSEIFVIAKEVIDKWRSFVRYCRLASCVLCILFGIFYLFFFCYCVAIGAWVAALERKECIWHLDGTFGMSCQERCCRTGRGTPCGLGL